MKSMPLTVTELRTRAAMFYRASVGFRDLNRHLLANYSQEQSAKLYAEARKQLGIND